MMIDVSKYVVTGDNMVMEVEDNSDAVLEELENKLKLALDTMGREAEGYAKQNLAKSMSENPSPEWRRSGHLLNSIGHKTILSDKAVYIGTNVEYAPYVEWGTGIYATNGQGRPTPWVWTDDKGKKHFTRGMKPRHFLKNAVDRHIDDYREIFEDILKQ